MTDTPIALLGLGFLLGLRHALDVDHLAAVSAIASARPRVRDSALVGAAWGLGHTAALLLVAVAVITLRADVPPWLARGLELAVAFVLIGLGAQVLWTVAGGGRWHLHLHRHGGRLHAHPHRHAPGPHGGPQHHHAVGAARTPFLVGALHGMAGSAGLMLAVLATIEDRVVALSYVAVFGVGSLAGMVAMSALLGAPMAWVTRRFATGERALRLAVGAGSVAVGLAVAWRVGVESGLLA